MDEGRAKGEGMGVGVGEKVPSGLHLRRVRGWRLQLTEIEGAREK
jgi:hypothetical protein